MSLALASSVFSQKAFADGGTLYYGLSSEPPSLETMVNSGTSERTVNLSIHRGLLNYGIDGKLTPELAESYDVKPGALEYTFKLRDAKFHDGSAVTSADVKATLERIIAKGAKAANNSELKVIKEIDTPDPKTVILRLSHPFIPLLDYLALPEQVVLPAAWIKEHGSDPKAAPTVGAGPYKFVKWDRGREIEVTKFQGYFAKERPYLDEIHYVFYPNAETRVNALKSGDVDIIEYVPWKDEKAIQADPNLKLDCTAGPFMALQFNTQSGPFSKPEVRQAVAYAIDRQAVINTAFNGVGTPIYGPPIPHGYMGYSEANARYFTHDPAKAKKMLADAGYPDGFEVRLLSTAQYDFHQNTAVVVQSDLAKIGIKVKLDLPDWAGRMGKASKGDYDFMVAGTGGDIIDADWMSSFYYGGENLVRLNSSPYFNDLSMNEMLDKGRITLDPALRSEIYQAFGKRANELSPIVAMMFRDQCYATRKNVDGFRNLPGFLSFLSGISIEYTKLQ